jgi:hypothetical protein|tara:strand:+ start:29 stop:1576 length:1548 start_codon:yes stop_codon:yes gene_type:complete
MCIFIRPSNLKQNMLWQVSRILRLWQVYPHILPPGKFIIVDTDGHKKTVSGWLPCHHGNVQYELSFKKNGDIARVLWMKMLRQKKRAPVSTAGKKIDKGKFAPMGYTKEEYLKQAEHAYRDQATWTVSVTYPYWRVCTCDIQQVFMALTNDPESLCTRYSSACIDSLLYSPQKALVAINNMLKTITEVPYDDLRGFEDRMQWQLETRYSTGVLKQPSEHVRDVQHYQGIWTTAKEIERAKILKDALTDRCEVWMGTPCRAAIGDRCVVVATLEEAFALKCFVKTKIYMLTLPFDEERRIELGLPGIRELSSNVDVAIPWAHRWGIDQWLKLVEKQPKTLMCIGRLDQYTVGRGQVFRQLVEASFPCQVGHHYKMNRVEMVTTEDVVAFVHGLNYPTVQCFSELPVPGIDTGRRWISRPRRIRTLTKRTCVQPPRLALQEEGFTLEVGENASVVRVSSVLTPVDVGVYICTVDTKSFDIHVARTLCRHKLFVVNCQEPPFMWDVKTASRISVSPFY